MDDLERDLSSIEESMRDDLELLGTPKLVQNSERGYIVMDSADFSYSFQKARFCLGSRIAYLIHKYI